MAGGPYSESVGCPRGDDRRAGQRGTGHWPDLRRQRRAHLAARRARRLGDRLAAGLPSAQISASTSCSPSQRQAGRRPGPSGEPGPQRSSCTGAAGPGIRFPSRRPRAWSPSMFRLRRRTTSGSPARPAVSRPNSCAGMASRRTVPTPATSPRGPGKRDEPAQCVWVAAACAGSAGSKPCSTLWNWNGTSWRGHTVGLNVSSVAWKTADDVWAVGAAGATAAAGPYRVGRPYAVRWNGHTWHSVSMPAPRIEAIPVAAVAASGRVR